MPAIKKPLHLQRLICDANALAESFGLDDEQTAVLRDRFASIANENYIAGNKAGIYWMRHGKTKASQLVNE